MQQCSRRLARDSAIPVRGAGRHAFEQTKHRSDPDFSVEGRHDLHFAGAGVGETGVHAQVRQSLQGGFRAVHFVHASMPLMCGTVVGLSKVQILEIEAEVRLRRNRRMLMPSILSSNPC